MKRVLAALGLITVSLIISSCQSSGFNRMTRFTLSSESVRLVQDAVVQPPVWVAVSYETTDEKDKASTVVLANGQLVDGELLFSHRVAEPTEVQISVNFGDNEDGREITTVLKPNTSVDVGLIYHGPHSHGLYLIRTNHRSLVENRRFSLVGNISALDGFEQKLLEPRRVYVALRATSSILDGSGMTLNSRTVLVDEGEFSIEGDLDEPTLVTLEIYERNNGQRWSGEYLHAILEPGVNYRVVPLGNNGKYAVQADRDSIHSRFVSSWQFDPTLVSLVDRWMDSQEQERNISRDPIEQQKEFINNYRIAEECDHLVVTDRVKLEFADPLPTAYQAIGNEIVKRRSASLREILRNTQDPELARMVFELSWTLFIDDKIYSDSDTDERIATLLELAQKMDQEFVDQFITPTVENYKRERDLILANRSLLPGQIAPEFTLNTITGDEVSLSKVLNDNELVLVDFWASWCGPCIKSFPALKKMYSKYKDRGFEIVTISLDDSLEDWVTASKTHELPWIDLGDTDDVEMNGWDASPSAMDYGVLGIPNKFLIDKEGCIVNKHFSDRELNTLLSRQAVF